MPTAEALERLPNGSLARPGIVETANEREGRSGRVRDDRWRPGHAAKDPGELAVVNAAVLILTPTHLRADVFLSNEQRVAGSVRDRAQARLASPARDSRSRWRFIHGGQVVPVRAVR